MVSDTSVHSSIHVTTLRNPFSKKHNSPAPRIFQGNIRRSNISKSVCSRREREIRMTPSISLDLVFLHGDVSIPRLSSHALCQWERWISKSIAMPCRSTPALFCIGKPQLMLKSVGSIPFMVVSATLVVCQKHAYASEIPKDSRAWIPPSQRIELSYAVVSAALAYYKHTRTDETREK